MLLWDVDGGAERPVLGGNGRSNGHPPAGDAGDPAEASDDAAETGPTESKGT